MIRIVNCEKKTLFALGIKTYPFKQGEIISFNSIKFEIMSINHELVFDDIDHIITTITVNKIS